MTDFFMNRKFMHIKGNNSNLNVPLFLIGKNMVMLMDSLLINKSRFYI